MKKNIELALQPGDSLEAFRRIVSDIGNSIVTAAQMLQRLCAADPAAIEQLSSGPDALPEAFLNGLLKVGERSLHPAILLNRCPAYRRLALMPYSTQESIIEKGKVDVVVGSGAGDVILVDIVKLEGEQLKQAIGPAGVRSLDEQRAWRKRQHVPEPTEKMEGPAYEIKKGCLRILRGNFELTRMEMLRLLEQMVGT